MKLVRRLFLLLGLIVLSVLWLGPETAGAAEQNSHKVRIGYTEHPGFIELLGKEGYHGLGVDFFNAIATYTGWQYEYIFGSRGELEDKLQKGQIDFMVPVMKTKEREDTAYTYTSKSLGTAASGLYVPAGSSYFFYDDFAHMDGMRIGGTPGSYQMLAAREYARKHNISFQEIYYPDYQQALAASLMGQVDAVALSSLYRINGYRMIARTALAPFYVVAAKGTGNRLLADLDAATERLTYEHASFLSNAFEKYYGRYSGARTPSLTREEQEYIDEQHIITVSCYTDWYPLAYYDEKTKNMEGILVDVFRQLAKKSGLRFKFIPLDVNLYKSSIGALKNKVDNMDLFIAVVATKARQNDKSLVFSRGYITNSRAFAGLQTRTFDIHEAYTVAIPEAIQGTAGFLKETYPYMQVVTYPNLTECLRAVKKGKADAVFHNSYIISAVLQHPEFEDMAIWDVSKQVGGDYYAAARSDVDPRLMSILNKYMDALAPDELQAIIFKHTSSSGVDLTWQDMLVKYGFTFKVASLLLLVILMGGITALRANQRHLEMLHARNVQLSAAINQANLANQAKTDFLSRMSHEIRTPLNAIIGLTEIARYNVADAAKTGGNLTKIEQASKLLLNIINDILDMSAIEHQRLKIASAPLNMKQLLMPLEEIYAQQCAAKQLNFKVEEILEQVPVLLGDSKRTSQILLNLLSNAVKFTPAGGTVTLTVSAQRQNEDTVHLRFGVSDTGIGMSEEFKQRLFKPFEQESANTFQKFGGSGLGLSIAHNLVKLMGGEISVDSREGVGTTFVVNLPFAVARAEAQNQGQDEPAKVDTSRLAGRHLLLAEDNKVNQLVTCELLKMQGIQVTVTENGRQAVDVFTSQPPHTFDAILMDIQMPVLNGYAAAKAIRASGKADAGKIPIIAVTADAFVDDVSKALSAGMNEHIAKPIDSKELYRVLGRLLGG